jgi:two-component system, cell cycle response regulator DivK
MKKNKILVIEDNEQNIYLVTFLLEKHGYTVLQALDGKEGIKKAAAGPDLILLDIHLPEIDGYDVARILKGNEATAGIPIVAVTSYVMAGDREEILNAGCEGYIEKPINPETFVDQISEFLK